MVAAISSPQRAELFVSKDSRHYLRMAEALADGQVVDSITQREHRQPLYPALLAVAMASGADTLMEFGTVNVVVGFATIFVLFGVGRWLFGSWWIGIVGGIAYASSEFIIHHIGERMMTEPTFALVTIMAVAAALKYLEDPRTPPPVAGGGRGYPRLSRAAERPVRLYRDVGDAARARSVPALRHTRCRRRGTRVGE